MYKSKNRSMQRGAQKRDTVFISAQDIYEKAPPKFSEHDRPHLEFGNRTREALIKDLRPFVRNWALSGLRKPSDVARMLNKSGILTACGGKWTPRLTWFLLSFMYQAEAKPKGKPVNGRQPTVVDQKRMVAGRKPQRSNGRDGRNPDGASPREMKQLLNDLREKWGGGHRSR